MRNHLSRLRDAVLVLAGRKKVCPYPLAHVPLATFSNNTITGTTSGVPIQIHYRMTA